MVRYYDLSRDQKVFANRLFSAALKAVTPDDPTGHLPNCGYSEDTPRCGCLALGSRLMQAMVDEVAAH